MHYNLRVEMERINGKVVTQIEVSGVGRCGRERLDSPDFDAALKDLKAAHDKLLGGVSDYHSNSHAPAAPAPAPKPVKDVQAAPAAQTNAKAEPPKKTVKRQFAKLKD